MDASRAWLNCRVLSKSVNERSSPDYSDFRNRTDPARNRRRRGAITAVRGRRREAAYGLAAGAAGRQEPRARRGQGRDGGLLDRLFEYFPNVPEHVRELVTD